MLEFVNQTFNQMPLAVHPLIVLPQDFCALMGRDHGFNALLQQIMDKMFSRIATIGDQAFKINAFQQLIRPGDVMALSAYQGKPQGIAKTIHSDTNFATEATATASQRLLTAFLERQPCTDEPAQWCCGSSHFPYQGRWQSIQTSAATLHAHTSAQSACKSCSISRTQPVITAIGHHSGSPISRRRRNNGNLPRFPRVHSGPASRAPEFLSIVRHLVSHRSCHRFIRFSQMSAQPSIRP